MDRVLYMKISLGPGEAGGLGRDHCRSWELTLKGLQAPGSDDRQGDRARKDSGPQEVISPGDIELGGPHVDSHGLGRLRGRESPTKV